MKTARLIAIDQNPKSTVVYADARITSEPWMFGEEIHGIGFTFDDGKYDALWDLAQQLSERGIEVEV